MQFRWTKIVFLVVVDRVCHSSTSKRETRSILIHLILNPRVFLIVLTLSLLFFHRTQLVKYFPVDDIQESIGVLSCISLQPASDDNVFAITGIDEFFRIFDTRLGTTGKILLLLTYKCLNFIIY